MASLRPRFDPGSGSPLRVLVALAGAAPSVALLLGCDTAVSVQFSTGPQEFEVSTASVDLPEELRDDGGNIESVPCGPMGMCPQSDVVTLSCEADVCDPAPKTLSAPVGGVIDVDALLADTREIGLRSVDAYEVRQVSYDVQLNALTFPVGPIEVFWGPEAATAIDPALGVHPFGTIPTIEPRQTPQGQMQMDPAGAAELSDYLVDRGSRVRFFARTTVDLDPGDPFPEGSIRVAVNATVRAVGNLVE